MDIVVKNRTISLQCVPKRTKSRKQAIEDPTLRDLNNSGVAIYIIFAFKNYAFKPTYQSSNPTCRLQSKFELLEMERQMQKRTFTKWINFHLEEVSILFVSQGIHSNQHRTFLSIPRPDMSLIYSKICAVDCCCAIWWKY